MDSTRDIRHRCFIVARASLLLVVASYSSVAAATTAQATLEKVGNSMTYVVHFNAQKGQYDSVSVNKTMGQSMPEPFIYSVKFGGTCEFGHYLDKSRVKLAHENHYNVHNWSGDTNYDHSSKVFGSYKTQNYKLIEACNHALQKKLGPMGGQTKAFNLWQVPVARVEHELLCSNSVNNTDKAYVDLAFNTLCEAAELKSTIKPKTMPPVLSAGFSVSQVDAAIVPARWVGRCPKRLTLQLDIKGVGAGTAKFRVVDAQGRRSGIATANLQKFGNSYRARITQMFTVPESVGDTTPGGGPLSLSANTSAGAGTINQIAVTPGASNQHKGSMRVEVLEPNHVVSNWASYDVTCNDKPAASGKGLSVTPSPQTPGINRKPGVTPLLEKSPSSSVEVKRE
jgi:hypothetical protein